MFDSRHVLEPLLEQRTGCGPREGASQSLPAYARTGLVARFARRQAVATFGLPISATVASRGKLGTAIRAASPLLKWRRNETDTLSTRQPQACGAQARSTRLGVSLVRIPCRRQPQTPQSGCRKCGTVSERGIGKTAVASLLVNINAESPRFSLEAVSVQTLVEHYREKELGKDSNKTFATCETYQGYFRKWILPRWGNYRLKDVKSVAVEEWLRSLDLSNGSKAKIRNIMHAVFNHAVRWEWHDRNPITHVRQSSKRKDSDRVDACRGGGIASLSRRADAHRCSGRCDDRAAGG
jgi:hypothetical protein